MKGHKFEMDYEETREHLLKSSSVEMSTNSEYTSKGTTSFVTSSYPSNSERSHLRAMRENSSKSNLQMEEVEVRLDQASLKRVPTLSSQQQRPVYASKTNGAAGGYPMTRPTNQYRYTQTNAVNAPQYQY